MNVALFSAFGLELGLESAAHALLKGWELREEVLQKRNPVGYLYVTGRNFGLKEIERRKHHAADSSPLLVSSELDPQIEPNLVAATATLTINQRTAVLLVYAFGYSYDEAAGVLDISTSSLRNHLNRGMHKLRANLGVGV